MSILNVNSVDAIGITTDGEGLVLMISDHLNWDNEDKHLLILQEKINRYIAFWEEKQYLNIYNEQIFKYCVIQICFLYPPTEKMFKFIGVVKKIIEDIHVQIQLNV